jgi:hypothetical protein
MLIYRFEYHNLATFEVLVLFVCADADYIVVYPQNRDVEHPSGLLCTLSLSDAEVSCSPTN